MTEGEAYKALSDAQKYLKYQDTDKFPMKLKKKMPIETVKSLSVLEAALQVDYKLCKPKRVVQELRKLKRTDSTSRSKLINDTIENCIKVFEDYMKY